MEERREEVLGEELQVGGREERQVGSETVQGRKTEGLGVVFEAVDITGEGHYETSLSLCHESVQHALG